ncbi:hypothetical protein [Pseudomonas zhanjiangensis]|uniref:Zinc ribbon domain-containing protein n=1 Tax=Pseudomonas zhanjiangensis TaxID=3239015 RepID=A0ABV3YSH3_9PSED
MSQCPKCAYRRTAKDAPVHPDICPACGIAINKWLARGSTAAVTIGSPAADEAPPMGLGEHFMRLPGRSDQASLYGRAVLSLALSLWTLWFMAHGIDWASIGGSFMHNINLPFHEFGHLLFSPLGRFMAILGGSLFQVLLPLILLVAFSFFHQDNYAASVTLWWSGQSLVDLAPYIADAPYRALPLVGGGGEESHDWGNLLSMTGSLDSAQAFARFDFVLGIGIMCAALLWGACLLRKQRRWLAAPHGDLDG